MSLSAEYRRGYVPRWGVYYAIFVSAFAALVLLLLILEQLGARKLWLSHILLLVPVFLYVVLAAMTRTIDVHEFFTAGRNVPPIFGGLSLAATALGGTGLFAFTGLLLLIGVDAMCIALGWLSGLLLAEIAFIPCLRKSGAYTLPGFFTQRFGSRQVGAVASLLAIPPLMLLLAAELRLGTFIISLFAAVSYETALLVGAAIIAVLPIMGGVRSLTWTQSAQYFVIAAGYLVPLVIVALVLTNLPLPQLTFAGVVQRLSLHELALGVGPAEPGPLAGALAGSGLRASVKPFAQAFGAISRTDFLLVLVTFLAGTAVMPSLLMRAGSSPNVFESRRTGAWGTLFLTVFLVSAPAYAAFTKFTLLGDLAGTVPARLPEWVGRLREAGLAEITDANGDRVIAANEILLSADGIALALPIVGALPFIVVALVAAGGIAATLAAGAAHACAIGATFSDDLAHDLLGTGATPGRRLIVARLAIGAAAGLAAWIVATSAFDLMHMASWAVSLAASAFLPALVFALWWPRTTKFGALLGMIAGVAMATLHIALAWSDGIGLFGLSGMIAAVLGAPVGAAAVVAGSLLSPPPPAAQLALLKEIRDPGGRAVHDRAVRRAARLQQRA